MRPPALLTIGWLVGGLSWVGAAFWPWTSRGLLSQSSLVEAASFARPGGIDHVVPPAAAFALLLPAGAGVLLVALAGLGGRAAGAARVVLGLLGAVAVVLLVGRLTDWSADRAGTGAHAALVGVALIVAAGSAQTILARSARATAEDQ